MEALISSMIAAGPRANRPPHISFVVIRSSVSRKSLGKCRLSIRILLIVLAGAIVAAAAFAVYHAFAVLTIDDPPSKRWAGSRTSSPRAKC